MTSWSHLYSSKNLSPLTHQEKKKKKRNAVIIFFLIWREKDMKSLII